MYKDCLYTYIRDIKCKYSSLVVDYNTALSHGKRNLECLDRQSRLIYMYLKMMQCYKTFDEVPTFLTAITLSNIGGNTDTVTIQITGSAFEIFAYTGSGDAIEIVASLVNQINSSSVAFEAEQDGSTIYIYSYSGNYDYTSTVSTTSSNSYTESTVSTSDIHIADIEALWNCITEEQLDGIICHAYKILNNRNVTTDCGCGC